MAFNIKDTTIYLTRGDTFMAQVNINKPNNEPYEPMEGDSIRFAMKQTYDDVNPLLVKDVPIDTMKLRLDPNDTKLLPFGTYVYDIQLTKATGEVDTFISKGKLKLTEEVH